jgi:acyl-coenzyme A thioesterase PaaI-like protein
VTPEELTARVREGVPLAGALGIEVLRAGPDSATLRLPPSPLSLADVAIWVPLLVATGGADETRTAQLQIAFLRPAGSMGVVAEVRIVRRGRSSLYAEVWMHGEGEEKPCAHATSTWFRAAPAAR